MLEKIFFPFVNKCYILCQCSFLCLLTIYSFVSMFQSVDKPEVVLTVTKWKNRFFRGEKNDEKKETTTTTEGGVGN